MPNIKEIANRINSVKSTQQITQAMKMVAAAKLSKAQQQLLQIRPYVDKLTEILNQTTTQPNQQTAHRYLEKRPLESLLIVVITSDRGLCGSFNTNVLRKTLNYTHKLARELAPEQITISPIGKKAFTFFQKEAFKLLSDYIALPHHLDVKHTSSVAELLINAFLQKTYDQILLVYNEFRSTTIQTSVVKQWLPIAELKIKRQEEQIAYIYEPSQADLVKSLIPLTLKTQFYKALLESNASEYRARMTTMSKATDNAEELLKTLRLTYSRTRQAIITREISEIVAAADSLST